MPHVTIEYSANLAEHHDIDALVAAVHAAAVGHPLVPADGMRTRAARRDQYRVADGDPSSAFVAIHVRVGPGRDPETKRSFITELLDAAETRLAAESASDSEKPSELAESPLAIMWSIELSEIDPETRINRNYVRPVIAARQAHKPASR